MDYQKIVDLVVGCKPIALGELTSKVSMKGDCDFVTAVDTTISETLKTALADLTPEVGFFSEEETGGLSDPCWILDPIDGTTNLVYGYNMSSISLALYQGGRVVFGVVYNPFNDDLFIAQLGSGATLNGAPIHVSDRGLDQALIEFGAGSTHKDVADATFAIAKEVFCFCVDLRRICSSALAICYIAAGRLDGYFEARLKPWDFAAAGLVLAEAGGCMMDYQGQPLQYASPTSIVASNGPTARPLLSIIGAHWDMNA